MRVITGAAALGVLMAAAGVAEAGKCDARAYNVRGQQVMKSCCPSPGGHRRALQNCKLPRTCPTVGCAKVFSSFVDDCQPFLSEMPARIITEYKQLKGECDKLLTTVPPTTYTRMPRGLTGGTNLRCKAKACEYRYMKISGSTVDSLVKAPAYPAHPNSMVSMKGTFSMSAKGDNLGVMMEGFVMAPRTGTYTFSTFSDDSSQVWVGTKPNSQRAVVLAVELKGCCKKVTGTVPVKWAKGQTYYIRAYLKEAGGGEYCRVGMTVAGKEYYPIPLTLFRIPGSFRAPPGMTRGTALRCGAPACEYQYTGIKGTSVASLTSAGRYPRRPNKIVKLTKGRFQMTAKGNNLGAMLEGFIMAPLTGRYSFSTRSDDASEVWVATKPNAQRPLSKMVDLRGCCRKVQGAKMVMWYKGKTYYIRYLIKEGSGAEYGQVGMKVGKKEWFPIPLSVFKSVGGRSNKAPLGLTRGPTLKCGAAACEYQYMNIGGTSVDKLTASKKYPSHPDKMVALTSGTFSMRAKGNNLGVMIEGFVMAPVTGKYTFSTHSDDSSQVWVAIRPNTQKRNLLRLAVELRGCCRKVQGKRQFSWKAKRTYYIRALVKEGGGGEYLDVGMKVGTKEWYPIPLAAFAKPGNHVAVRPPGVPGPPAGLTSGTKLKCGAPVCEYRYSNIPGASVQSLTSAPQYPMRPSKIVKVTKGTFSMSQKGDNFGVMMEGYFLAPETATYTFSTRSDDASVVYVATQPNTQQGLVKAVELTGCCRKVMGTRKVQWHKGGLYYIRAAVKEAAGGEYLYVGVTVALPIATVGTKPTAQCKDGDVRVAPGTKFGAGLDMYPEVNYQGKWYPVCGHYFWDSNEGATTFCKALGFAKGVRGKRGAKFTVDAMPVGKCKAGQTFNKCTLGGNAWGNFNFLGGGCKKGHGIGQAVRCIGGQSTSCVGTCKDGDVRVASGSTIGAGLDLYPEVNYRGKWYPVCGHYFWDNDHGATSFCKALGFAKGVRGKRGAKFAVDAMPVGKCRPGQNFKQCNIGGNAWGNFNYRNGWCKKGHGIGVAVKCSGGTTAATGTCKTVGDPALKTPVKEYFPIPITQFRFGEGGSSTGAPASAPGMTTGTALRCGAAVCEYQYTKIGGSKVADLLRSPKFPRHPNKIVKVTKGTFSMTMKGDNLGIMMEGFVRAPVTGAYTFSTRSDDSSAVWAATAPSTQANLRKVVELNGCCRKVQGKVQLQWQAGQAYYIRAYVKEGGGAEYGQVGMKVGTREWFPIPVAAFVKIGSQTTAQGPSSGTQLACGAAACEYQYRGIGGTAVSALTKSKKFPQSPDKVVALTTTFSMTMKGNNLGVMIEGFVRAPVTGVYTFSTKSDDSSEVWVSRTPRTQSGLVKVVELRGCCRKVRGIKKITWQAGQAYYIRAYVKEGGGGEYGQFGMMVQGREWFPIPIKQFVKL